MHFIGSSRLGVYNINQDLVNPTTGEITTFERGRKFFELSNHLGNVLVTLSDKKIGVDGNSDGVIDYYTADVITANDYYPGGMDMPGRQFNATTGYRYGFNTQEKSDEIAGEGNHYTALYWEYDPRTGRRWNIDPVRKESLSGYSANALNPIWYMDPLGDDWYSNDQGMFIWSANPSIMMSGFRNYHGTELPEGLSNNQVLTTIPGQPGFYYQYKSNSAGKFFNWLNGLFGYAKDNVTLKKYTWHDVALAGELRDYALLGVLGKMISPAAKSAMSILKGSGGSLWKITSWLERGFVYEASQGGNLIKNYPVIDKFVKGVATSIKTLDFSASTYAKNTKAIYNTLKGYIDKLADFEGAIAGGVDTRKQITSKILNVGVPKGANEEQIKMFQQAIEYGKSLNVEVQIKAVK